MTNEEFLEEVLNSDICPKDFQFIYKDFQEYQKLADNTLKEFHRVCEKNSIPYQLAYGSLLGAIRDNGQIPWDYDVDVFVPYEKKDKLIKALKRDLDKAFYFYCPEIDEKCRHMFMRLAPVGYRSEVLHVDVFYLAGTPDEEEKIEEYCNKIEEISKKRYNKLVRFFDENTSIKNCIRKSIKKMKLINYKPKVGMKEINEIVLKYSIYQSKYCVTVDTFSNCYRFNSNDIKETKLINTKLGELRVPIEYKNVLSLIYGDYNNPLLLTDRIDEIYNSYTRLRDFAKK